MDRSNIIKLLGANRYKDEYGVWQEEVTERCVFCDVRSVTRAEFFEGGRNGLNPQYEFVLFAGDYEGESIVEYNGQTYAVYRTYMGRNDALELYVERKGGTNGKT